MTISLVCRALSEVIGEGLPYDTLDEVRDRLSQVSPALVAYGTVENNNYFAQARQLAQVYTTPINVNKTNSLYLSLLSPNYKTLTLSSLSLSLFSLSSSLSILSLSFSFLIISVLKWRL